MERAILFDGDKVRAILAGTLALERRPVRMPAAASRLADFHHLDFLGTAVFTDGTCVRSPFGKVGDRLWVKETWAALGHKGRPPFVYRADQPEGECVRVDAPWRSSVHMPREASRILLEVTGVRVERQQPATEEHALSDRAGETSPWLWVVDFTAKQLNKESE
ncbi:hypothetical protein [Geopseudomonas aromaticivorans]